MLQDGNAPQPRAGEFNRWAASTQNLRENIGEANAQSDSLSHVM